MTGLNRRMSDEHESYLATLFRGRRSRGSGNQFAAQMDGRTRRHEIPFAFAWDAKSTLGKGIMVTRGMWEKAQEQAGLERPMLALRWYSGPRLGVDLDLVIILAEDLAEILLAVEASPEPDLTPAADHQTFEEWLQQGRRHGWCSKPVCETHDGLPSTPEEDAEWEDGHDPCVHAVRLYPEGGG